jgi:hypothetical protein
MVKSLHKYILNHQFFCPNLLNYYKSIESGSKKQKYKGEIEFIDGNGDIQLKKQEATAIGILINFRNHFSYIVI